MELSRRSSSSTVSSVICRVHVPNTSPPALISGEVLIPNLNTGVVAAWQDWRGARIEPVESSFIFVSTDTVHPPLCGSKAEMILLWHYL